MAGSTLKALSLPANIETLHHCSRRCGLLHSLQPSEDGIIAHIADYPPVLLPAEAFELLTPLVGRKILLVMFCGQLQVIAIDGGAD